MNKWQKLRDPGALRASAGFRLRRMANWIDHPVARTPLERNHGAALYTWDADDRGTVFGVPFRVVRSNFDQAKTTASEIVILKWKQFFDDYTALFPEPPKRILEVGFFEGGSTFMLAAMWPKTEIIGIDLRGENGWVKSHVNKLGLADRVHLHYSVGQNDRAKISKILESIDFRPDLIIDDASHRYGFSKETFDITFPYLVPGGAYVLEDWGWAHVKAWRHFKQYADDPALSNLVCEVTMAAATSPEIIDRVSVNRRIMTAIKNQNCGPLGSEFSLDAIYTARGKNPMPLF